MSKKDTRDISPPNSRFGGCFTNPWFPQPQPQASRVRPTTTSETTMTKALGFKERNEAQIRVKFRLSDKAKALMRQPVGTLVVGRWLGDGWKRWLRI